MARSEPLTEPGQPDSHKPIGYLLKRLDEAIEEYVNDLLGAQYQLGRFHWQLLRSAHLQPGLDRPTFAASATMFYDDQQLTGLIADLVNRDWIRTEGPPGAEELSLTDAGESGFAAMSRTQQSSWARLRQGITDDEYLSTVLILEKMINNMEAA
jgi:DNA-binding MarR family transcriptional regulator